MAAISYQPLLEVSRAAVIESVHYGALAVVDAQGKLLFSHGDPDTVTFLRSSAKPFQALPFVEMGGAEAFGLSDREVAVMCASHSGTDEHVSVLRVFQQKIGVSEENLLCGSHPPMHEPTWRAMQQRGEEPTPLRHNCSGKHTGMLAQARLRSLSLEDYINPQHPLQKTLLAAFAEMCGLPPEQIELGVDGCSAPVFAVPLRSAALAYARLSDPAGLPEKRAAACRRITQAMSSHPDMVAGPGRFDTALMQAAGGKLVAKGGAEGYYGIGLLAGALGPQSPGLGITLKIADGDLHGRAAPVAALAVLRRLGALTPAELEALAEFDARPIYNWRHLAVGEIKAVF